MAEENNLPDATVNKDLVNAMGRAIAEKKLTDDTNTLITQIINEQDSSKLNDLTDLFDMVARKKKYVRMHRLFNILDKVDSEVDARLQAGPDDEDRLNNDQLIKVMNVTQQAVSDINNDVHDKPLVQINTQNNNIDFGLNRESRQRVIDAVMSIINQKDNNKDEEGL